MTVSEIASSSSVWLFVLHSYTNATGRESIRMHRHPCQVPLPWIWDGGRRIQFAGPVGVSGAWMPSSSNECPKLAACRSQHRYQFVYLSGEYNSCRETTWLPDYSFRHRSRKIAFRRASHVQVKCRSRISTLAHLLISQQVVWGEMEVLQCFLLLGKPEGLKPAFIWSYFNKGGSLILLICPFFLFSKANKG